jgi:hypothetical protein
MDSKQKTLPGSALPGQGHLRNFIDWPGSLPDSTANRL